MVTPNTYPNKMVIPTQVGFEQISSAVYKKINEYYGNNICNICGNCTIRIVEFLHLYDYKLKEETKNSLLVPCPAVESYTSERFAGFLFQSDE